MKFYLISNVSGAAEPIINVLDSHNANVVSKEVRAGIEEVSENIEGVVRQGNADMLIFLTSAPVKACIELNKREDLRAALCYSPEDIEAASRADANVIIINSNLETKEEMAEAIVSGFSGFKKVMDAVKMRTKKVETVQPTEQMVKAPEKAGKVRKLVKDEGGTQVEEEEEPFLKNPRKGLIGKIKDELGIID